MWLEFTLQMTVMGLFYWVANDADMMAVRKHICVFQLQTECQELSTRMQNLWVLCHMLLHSRSVLFHHGLTLHKESRRHLIGRWLLKHLMMMRNIEIFTCFPKHCANDFNMPCLLTSNSRELFNVYLIISRLSSCPRHILYSYYLVGRSDLLDLLRSSYFSHDFPVLCLIPSRYV